MVVRGYYTTYLIEIKLNSNSGSGGMDCKFYGGHSSGKKSAYLPVIFHEIRLPKLFSY